MNNENNTDNSNNAYLYWCNRPNNCPPCRHQVRRRKDHGPNPYVTNIEEETLRNDCYRRALWTGEYLQLTLMSIESGSDIGLEMHPDIDQFIRIEQGQGLVEMGERSDCMTFQRNVSANDAIFIPAGRWHNLINTGSQDLRLYSIYAPPNHPHGTVQAASQDAQ
jgi:mannose-6-phosphate isomerase-like protein (cupin superfamily)